MKTPILGAAILTLALGLSGCGSDAPADDTHQTGTPTAQATQAADKLCDSVDEIEAAISLLDVSNTASIKDAGKALSEAHETLAGFEPDEAIAKDWAKVEGFLEVVAKAYEGVDMGDKQAVKVAEGKLKAEGEEFFAEAMTITASGDKIMNHVETTCGTGDGARVTDLCEMLSQADLSTVFPDEIPEPRSTNLGGGALDCQWEIDNDDMHEDDFQVGIAMMPLADLEKTFTAKMTPLGTISGLDKGQSFDGAFGVMRASTRGHSVVFTHGDSGVVVSVQKGNDSSPEDDLGPATAFAKKVEGQL